MYISESVNKSAWFIRFFSVLFLSSVLLMPASAFGGSLEAPTGPTTQGNRYTLGHIYNLLKTGTEGTAVSGTFSGPSGSIATTLTTTPDNNTLNDIYTAAPKPATTSNTGATRNDVCDSKSYFSLLKGSTTPSGTWGLLTGLKDCTAAPTATDVNVNLGNEPTTQQNIPIATILAGCTDTDSTLDNSSITVSANKSVRGADLGTSGSNITYTPNPSTLFKYLHAAETTKDAFNYTCTDGISGHARTATVYITVNGIDDAPVASNVSKTITEDTAAAFNFPVTSADRDVASLTYQITASPTHGSASLISNSNAFIYTPDLNNTTQDTFSYKACVTTDTTCSNTRTVTINFTAVDDPPVITTNKSLDVTSGGTATITTAELNVTDPDTANANLTYTVTAIPTKGDLEKRNGSWSALAVSDTFTKADIVGNDIRYNDGTASTGDDSFTFSVSDGTTTLTGNVFDIFLQP